jgi:hypothetical protein
MATDTVSNQVKSENVPAYRSADNVTRIRPEESVGARGEAALATINRLMAQAAVAAAAAQWATEDPEGDIAKEGAEALPTLLFELSREIGALHGEVERLASAVRS